MKFLRFFSFLALAGAIAITYLNIGEVRTQLQAQIDSLAKITSSQLSEVANSLRTVANRPANTVTEKIVGAAGTEVPVVIALFSTSIASAISSSATSMTLVSATDKDGNALASSTYPFIIDEGTASEELVIADCTSTACTNMIRGVSVLTGTSSVTALKKSHRRGASVKITDGPQLMILSRMLNGIGKLPNVISYLSHPTFSSGTQLVDKTYADAIAIAGGATSTESTSGISKLATQLKMASSTFSSTDPTVLYSLYSTSTPSAVCGLCVPITQNNGKLHQSFLDLTQAYTWTGAIIFTNTGTTTFSGGIESGTKIAAPYFNATSTNATSTFQGGIRSSCFSTDGTNCIGGFEQIYASTTVGAIATSTFTSIPARTILRVVLDIPTRSACSPTMQFNGDTTGIYSSVFYAGYASQQSQSAKGALAMGTLGDTGATTMYFDINNIAAKAKAYSYTGQVHSDTAVGSTLSGGGVWNNTSAQITSIQVGCGSALPTATKITIFGSAN